MPNLISRLRSGLGNDNNNEIKSNPTINTPIPQPAVSQLSIPQPTAPPVTPSIPQPNVVDYNISTLVSVTLQGNRLNNPEVSQGDVGELYTLYTNSINATNEYNETQAKEEDKIKTMELELKNVENTERQKVRDEELKETSRYQKQIALVKQNIEDKINSLQDKLSTQIEDLTTEYELEYQDNLSTTKDRLNAITNFINDFQIPRRAIKIPNQVNIEDLTPEGIFDLVVEDAKIIQQLEDIDINADLSKLGNLFNSRNKVLNSAGVIALTTILSPFTLSVGIFKIGKQVLLAKKIRGYIKEIEDEILLCERILQKMHLELEGSYSPPDVSDLEEAYEEIPDRVKEEFQDQLDQATKQLNDYKAGEKERHRNLNTTIMKLIEEKEDELERYKASVSSDLNRLRYNLNEINTMYSNKREEFINKQVLPDFRDTIIYDKLQELNKVIKNIRTINEYELMNSLTYNTEVDNTIDDPDELGRREYDRLLVSQLEDLKKEVDKLNDNFLSKDVLENTKEKLQREIDNFYKLTTNNLHEGNAFISQDVANLLKVQELSKSKFDNRSILFLYSNTEEEDFMVDYVKYLTQQILNNFHPSAVRVNIISRERSSKFNNLQVSLDKFDPKTRQVKKGDPYCLAISDPVEIKELYEEQLSQLSRFNASDLIDKDFDEMVLYRRKIGGIVPKYQINILHREEITSEILTTVEESHLNGIVNYVLAPTSDFYNYDNTGKLVVNKKSIEIMSKFSLMAELRLLNNFKTIYLTDFKANRISRLLYAPRTKEEITQVSTYLRDKALKILSESNFTLVKEYIDEQTGGEYWKGDATKQLEIHLGYVEGDKSKPYPIILNEDDRVHMFIGGTTGGGKSNVLGVIVNSLKMMYPPSQLDIFYFDFKVVEVAIHTKPYKMPHCSAMTGTSSAEYLISLLRFIFDEMMDRYSLMNKWGVQKLSELQKKMRDKIETYKQNGETDKADKLFQDMPRRMVVIIDEIAQGFKHPDTNVVETIKEITVKLGELARAAGIHLIMVSQEPTKIPQTLFDLCKIKGCTKATTSVSKAVIGNDLCGRLENQFIGFFGTNDGNGDEDANRRYVVPLNTNEASKVLSKIAYQMSQEDINRNAVIFSDNDPYEYSALKRYLTKLNIDIDNLLKSTTAKENASKYLKGNNFYLGETAYFMRDFEPFQAYLFENDMENLAIVSSDKFDIYNHFQLIYKQVSPYAVCVPIYCKSIPDYATPQMFKENNLDNTLYCPMFAKNIIDEKDVYEIEQRDEQILDENGNMTTRKKVVVKDKTEFNVYQVVKGDVFTVPQDRSDDIKMDYYSKDLLRYLNTVIKLRKKNPEIYAKYPLYLFAFDFTSHSAIATNMFPWRELMSAINDANNCGVHLIAFTNTVSPIDSRNIFSKVIAGRLMADEQYRDYKNIPDGFCKYVDKRNSANNRVYKVARCEDDI